MSSNVSWVSRSRSCSPSFDDTPLAAASIAQVHRARLHDGTDVAVKVRRPHLRGRIEQDLRLFRLLGSTLARAGAIGETLNPSAIVDDLALTLRAELDFEREAASMVSFAANLAVVRRQPRLRRALSRSTEWCPSGCSS